MAVDYADKQPKRKKPSGKKGQQGGPKRASSKKAAQAQRAKARQRRVGALLVLLFVGFFALLFGLRHASQPDRPDAPFLLQEPSGDEQNSPDTNGDLPEQSALEALPQAPQERWRYIEELENHEVEVIVPERGESARRLMQCGSFRRETDAQALRANIAMNGYESQVRRTESAEHGVWFRVILGPFDGLRAAQSVNNQLRRGGIHGCQIWLWNLD